MFTIRNCEAHDYDAIAQIHNQIQPEPTTGAEMRRSDATLRSQEGVALVRVVAEDEGQVLAYGFAERTPWMQPGDWFVKAMVGPEARGRGIGRAIYEQMKQVAVDAGATTLESWVQGHDDESWAWAQRRGFALDRQRTESVLSLKGYDLARFAGAQERVEAGGLRLATTTEADDDLLRQIWELDCICTPDVPCYQPDEKLPTFEEYRKMWREDPTERVVAGCFDGDRLIGVSILYMPIAEGGGAYTGFTGTYREYRGRGVALAVKLLTIEEGLKRSIPHMRTNNDPDNPSMLAVNEKLGYVLVPGPRRVRLPL